MTDKTDSELVFTHIQTNPEVFLEALNDSSPETKEAILSYMRTLPEIEATNDKPADTLEK